MPLPKVAIHFLLLRQNYKKKISSLWIYGTSYLTETEHDSEQSSSFTENLYNMALFQNYLDRWIDR